MLRIGRREQSDLHQHSNDDKWRVDEISRRPYWDVKTKEEFVCSTFMRLVGGTMKMNVPDLLPAASPWKTIFVKKLSCARFVNGVKTTGTQTHCWACALPCSACILRRGEKWTKAVEAITNPHSHKKGLIGLIPVVSVWIIMHVPKLLLKSLCRTLVVGGQWVHPAAVATLTCQLTPHRPSFSSLKVALVFPNPLGTLL